MPIKSAIVKGAGSNEHTTIIVIDGKSTDGCDHQREAKAIYDLFRAHMPCGTTDRLLVMMLQNHDFTEETNKEHRDEVVKAVAYWDTPQQGL